MTASPSSDASVAAALIAATPCNLVELAATVTDEVLTSAQKRPRGCVLAVDNAGNAVFFGRAPDARYGAILSATINACTVASRGTLRAALLGSVRVRVQAGRHAVVWYGTLAPWEEVSDANDRDERLCGSVPVRSDAGVVVVVSESTVTVLSGAATSA